MEYLRQDPDADPLDLAYEYNNLGAIYNAVEDYSNAEKYYLQSLDLSKEASSNKDIVVSYINLGLVYFRKGDFGKALDFVNESNKILNTAKYKNIEVDKINCCHLIANCFISLNKLDSASTYLSKLDELHSKTKYRINITYERRAKVYLENKIFDKARIFFTKTLEINEKKYGKQHPFVAISKANIGDVYLKEGKNIKLALSYFLEAIVSNSIGFEMASDWHKNPAVKNVIDKSLMLSLLSQKIKALKALYEEGNKDVSLEDIYATALLSTEVLTELNKKVMNVEAKRFWLNKEAVPVYEQAIGLALELAK